MYNNYLNFLDKNESVNIEILPFKSNNQYCGILEHVSIKHGTEYLELIFKEFPSINTAKIVNYCKLNDKYGDPNKYEINVNDFSIVCSPTSLRYIYHSLLILKYIETTDCKNIVEVGCGYGGLCLAINYFIDEFQVDIDTYNIVDITEPINLIQKYLGLHKENMTTKMEYHDSLTYGKNIKQENLFFISNYCYTEISCEYNSNYTDNLITNVDNGFIVWQNGGNKGSYPVKDARNILKKNIVEVEEERPQTDAGYDIYKNYFVYF